MKLHVYFVKNDGTRMHIFRGNSFSYVDRSLVILDKNNDIKHIIPSFLHCEVVSE